MTELQFEKEFLIYIPCYNCEKSVSSVIKNIPIEFWHRSECLILDNCSTDSTVDVVRQEIQNGNYSFKISLIQPKKNLGYAGSQKLAYQLVLKSPKVKNVIMLHGDGQYPPKLIAKFLPYAEAEYGLVNGYRCKQTYPHQEQTPWLQNTVINVMNALENFVTGINQKEWHSGFVMYSFDFLKQVPFGFISDSYHLDGEMLIIANILRAKTLSISIYKYYNKEQKLIFWSRVQYVLTVLKLMQKYSKAKIKSLSWDENDYSVDYDYAILESLQEQPLKEFN